MAKICHQEEIVIGIPIAGRRHADLENIMGMFVNTLALKSGPQNDKFYSSFLEEVREKTLGAYENQEYQFEDLVEKLVKKRDASRNPLFDVLFVLQNIDFVEVRVPGLTVEPYPYKSNISQFDLYFMAIEEEDRLVFNVGYRVDLFKQETVERFIRYFKEIAAYVPQHKDRELRLKDIQISHDLIDREIYIPDKNFDF
jgi:non-ribosomal peptide synthetase component F